MRPLVLLLVALPAVAAEYVVGGSLESDVRLSLPGKDPPPGADELRFLRTDNTARLKLRAFGDDVSANLDAALIYRGVARPLSLDDTRSRELSDPYDIESDALYVTFQDFVAEGVMLRVGRQIVQWGAADQFNPTSVLNPLDLEDPVKFGDRVPNEMLLLSWVAPWTVDGEDITLFDELTFTGVFVPVHRPGQYPESSRAVFTDPDLFVQFVDSPLLASFVDLQKAFIAKGGVFTYETDIQSEAVSLENSQYAGRVSFTAVGIDFSAMYYQGYSDALQASEVDADLDSDLAVLVGGASACEPGGSVSCGAIVGALLEGKEPKQAFGDLQALLDSASGLEGTIPTHVLLTHPKVKVVGFDATTSLDFMGGVGLWGEAAVTFHDDQELLLRAADQVFVEKVVEGGHFWKVAAGLDYTILPWWYVNAQYLHGFVDEFGKDRLKDYVVAGSQFKFFNEQLDILLFGIFQPEDGSYVVYPNIASKFWQGGEVSVGAFWMGGDEDSKFGSAATGQSRVYVKGKYSF